MASLTIPISVDSASVDQALAQLLRIQARAPELLRAFLERHTSEELVVSDFLGRDAQGRFRYIFEPSCLLLDFLREMQEAA